MTNVTIMVGNGENVKVFIKTLDPLERLLRDVKNAEVMCDEN